MFIFDLNFTNRNRKILLKGSRFVYVELASGRYRRGFYWGSFNFRV